MSSSSQQHTSRDHGNSTQKKRPLSTVVVSNNHNSNNSDSIATASDSRDHDEEKLGVVHHNSKRVRTVGATTVEARRNEIGDQQPPRDQTKTHPPTTVLGRAFEPNDSHHLFPFLFETHHNEYVPR